MLTSMKKNCAACLFQKNKDKFKLECEMEQFQETINERKEIVAQMEKELANEEAAIESMKQMLQSSKKTDQIETMKQDLVRLETVLKHAKTERVKVIEDCQATNQLLASKKEDVARQLSEMDEHHKMVKDGIVKYVDGLKEQISGFITRLDVVNADLDNQIVQLQTESKQRKKWLNTILKKNAAQP
uniref:Uncharacterized protein n=2 Tax=Arion vulgaris TaxID=1028688 RepID=A0A0B6ZPD4_9EUPU